MAVIDVSRGSLLEASMIFTGDFHCLLFKHTENSDKLILLQNFITFQLHRTLIFNKIHKHCEVMLGKIPNIFKSNFDIREF